MASSLKVRLLRRLGSWVARRTPQQRLAWARRLQPLARALARKRVRVARTNLRLCFPELPAGEREALLARTLVANLKGLLDACVAWYGTAPVVESHYEVVGLQHLRAAVDSGQGILVLGAHFHGSELHMRAVRELAGMPTIPLVRSFRDPALDAELNARRSERLGGVIPRGDVRALCAVVRGGGLAVYTPDVNARRRHVFAPFFGIPAATLDGLGSIARRAGGMVVPTFARPLPGGRYQLVFEPPWPGLAGSDGLHAAIRYNAWVEARVREAPEAYDWGVKRFKTRPPGTADVYDQRL